MNNISLSKELRDFIASEIDSVEQIEILFFLMEESERACSAAEVARRLHFSPDSVAQRLTALCQRRFCMLTDEPEPRYRYAPDSSGMDKLVRDLLEAYKTHRVTVITLIYSKPLNSMHAFPTHSC